MPDIVRGEIIDDAPEIRGYIDGVRGESAYDVAVRNGFVGTEEEWLESLKGEKGDPGQNGFDGTNGVNGVDGVSPTVSVTDIDEGHRVTITDAQGAHSFDVMDGDGAEIDLSTYVQKTDIATGIEYGLVKVNSTLNSNVTMRNSGNLYVPPESSEKIKAGSGIRVIVPTNQHEAVFYGLAKVAGADEKDSQNELGTYSEEAKAAIKNMLGVEDGGTSDYTNLTNKPSINNVTLSGNKSLSDIGVHNIPTGGTQGQVLKKSSATDYDTEWADESGAVTDVQINGSSVVTDGVANVPLASSSSAGTVVISANTNNGLYIENGTLKIGKASLTYQKAGTNDFRATVPSNQHNATFYGLAKAAGDTTQSQSSNAVGNYTDSAKVAIQKMLGIYEAPWELIADVTTTENVAEVVIDTDTTGQPFELTEMIVLLVGGPSTTGNRDNFRHQYAYISNNGSLSTGSLPAFQSSSGTANIAMRTKVKINQNAPVEISTVASASISSSNSINCVPSNIVADGISKYRVFQYSDTTSLIPSGTNIKLYGKRKWN